MILAVSSFVFAAAAFLVTVTLASGMIYGIFYSGDPADEMFAGIMGLLVLGAPFVVALLVYSLAGIGLLKRTRWGYLCHLVGAVLAIFSCVGIVYTVFAFVVGSKPEFRAAFSAHPDERGLP